MKQLTLNQNGRLQLGNREFTCGDPLEVLILDGSDKATWRQTTVEAVNGQYYLTGLAEYDPVGLFARIV